MISRLGLFLSRTIGRLMPDPFILALGLTIVTAILALVFGYAGVSRGEAATSMLQDWWDTGIWSFLRFSMQMAMILISKYC